MGAAQELERRHAYDERAAGLEHAGHLGDGGPVVRYPVVVDHVERRGQVEGPGREGQLQHGAAHGPHSALAAELDRVLRQVDAGRGAEAREGEQVVAGATAGVEQAQLAPAGPRLDERERYGALARVPPLPLLRLEHPAVLARLHRRVASEVK